MDQPRGFRPRGSVSESLRDIPLFAGLPNTALNQIAKVVSDAAGERIAASFRKVSLFEGLDDVDLLRVQSMSKTKMLAEGEILFKEGEEGDAFYVVLEGAVELTKRGPHGNEEKLAVARDGEPFGEMALLNDIPRSATARASQASTLLMLPRASFQELLGGNTVAAGMLQSLSRALWATSVRLSARTGTQKDPQAVVRDVSRVMQRSILPHRVPTRDDYQIAASTRSPEGAEGNSTWDWFDLPDGRLALAVMFVDGTGLPAGHYLSIVRAVFREAARSSSDLNELLGSANDALRSSEAAGIDQLVECGLLALAETEAEWASAGRLSGAVVRASGTALDLPSGTLPLGMRSGATYQTFPVPLLPGDWMVVFSNAAKEVAEAARAVVIEGRAGSATQLLPEIHNALGKTADGEPREATAALVKRGAEED